MYEHHTYEPVEEVLSPSDLVCFGEESRLVGERFPR